AEAMDKLADSARETVTVIRSFGDEWGRVQRSVQQELFEGTAEPVRRAIDNILPSLETGMTGVASRLGEGAQLAADELSNQWSRGGLERLFRNVEGAIGDLNPAIQPLMASFRTIAVTGSNFLPGMARGLPDWPPTSASSSDTPTEPVTLPAGCVKGLIQRRLLAPSS